MPAEQSANNTLVDNMESEEFDRVQWAKCQARAERYQEEVELTVEEMGRTLRYFEWKRDWWLSLAPAKSNALAESTVSGESNTPGASGKSNAPGKSNASPPADIQAGLRAYACRQSSVYDNLIASFVNHWRKYLLAHSLGTAWLKNYPPPADPTPVRPSRGHRRSDAGPSPVAEVSAESMTSEPPIVCDADAGAPTDAPIDGGSDDDDVMEGTSAGVVAEDMFVVED